MRAAVWNAPGSLSILDVDEPRPAAGQAVIEVDRCGICGSDLHSYHRGVVARPGQILGHEFSGTVLDAPGVAGLAEGDRVTVRPLVPCGACDRCIAGDIHLCEADDSLHIGYGTGGAFAERVLVPRAIVNETVFRLPDELPMADGALVEPLAVSFRLVRLAAIEAGDAAMVFGLGPIGLGAVQTLALSGAGLIVAVDPSATRRAAAHEFGADVTVDPTAQSALDVARELRGVGVAGRGGRFDVALECSGAAEPLRDALRVVRGGGRVMLAAVYGRRVELSPDIIVGKEVRLQGSYAYRDEFPRVIELLRTGRLRAKAMVSHTFALQDIVAAFEMQSDPSASLKVLVEAGGR